MYNCTLTSNSGKYGGGASGGTLSNCTLVGNLASSQGGGTYEGTVYNSIIYSNDSPTGPNWRSPVGFTNCCTTPTNALPGTGNITNDPMFITSGSGYGTNHVAGNYRLADNSPCINAGLNQDWMTGAVDRDGHSRLDRFSGIVDMGAYEYIHKGTIFTVP